MKKIIGISLTCAERNHKTIVRLGSEKVSIERIGTDGSFSKARELFLKYDGEVDAFGLGGIDLTLGIGKYRFRVKDAEKLIEGLKTPVFDGNGIKDILDRSALAYISKKGIELKNKKVFMMCASNRSGMAHALEEYGCKVIYGDLMFGMKLPVPIRSLKIGRQLCRVVLPIATKMPYNYIYPIGKNQSAKKPKYTKYFEMADIIAGDFHYIKKYSPERLKGKIIITTTNTKRDMEELKKKGVSVVITTTPEIDGRCFGSNIIEALLYSLDKSKDFKKQIASLKMAPSIKYLNSKKL